ncbi:uncharacterized protein TNCV_3306541 [Trichonephila clavipes]|nr:uncharacterized protein TNCV_3306541 [Trichonephila clavipes]
MQYHGVGLHHDQWPHAPTCGCEWVMTGQRYIDEVLLPHVRLFRGAVGDKFVFLWTTTQHVIEHSLQVAGRNYPPTNKNTLIRALTEEWDKLPQQLLDNVVQSMVMKKSRRFTVSTESRLNSALSLQGDRLNSCQVIYSQFGLAIHQNDHQARRRFVEWAQNEIAVVPDFHKRILFSDEAHSWLNGYVNKQNCHIWSEANPQVYVETPLHPEKLTVWCALWAGGILLQKR